MPMIYVKDAQGRSFALPDHILEDFEVSNIELPEDLGSVGHTGSGAPANNGSLDELLGDVEVSLTLGELADILGLGRNAPGRNGSHLPHGLCAGIQEYDFDSTRPVGANSAGIRHGVSGFTGTRGGLDLCGGLPRPELDEMDYQFGNRPYPDGYGGGSGRAHTDGISGVGADMPGLKNGARWTGLLTNARLSHLRIGLRADCLADFVRSGS